MINVKCETCKQKFLPSNNRKRFCGHWKQWGTCAYKNRKKTEYECCKKYRHSPIGIIKTKEIRRKWENYKYNTDEVYRKRKNNEALERYYRKKTI